MTESLNTKQKELGTECRQTKELKEKLSEHQQRELETKYCQTDVSLEQDLHQLQAEIMNVTELLNSKQKELETERLPQLSNKFTVKKQLYFVLPWLRVK